MTPSEKLKEVADKYNTLFAPSTTPENHCAIYTFALVLRNNGDALICPDAEEQRGLFGNVRERSMKEIAQRVCIE